MAKRKQPEDSGITISGNNNSVVVGNSDLEMSGGSGEMEDDLVRVFRGFSMREKTRCLQGVYDFEDKCAEEREKQK